MNGPDTPPRMTMRAADLARAMDLAKALDRERATHRRLVGGEPLAVTLGAGADASRLHLAAAYERGLRADLTGALAERIVLLERDLAALGVEG